MRAVTVWLASMALGVAVVGSPNATAMVAALVITALLAAQLTGRLRPQSPHQRDVAPALAQAERRRVVRHCDPDAAGRPRPRAPSA
jgi:hypothetical protein